MTSTRGGSSARNLIPLPIRFWKSWRSWPSSARTVGRSDHDHVAPDSVDRRLHPAERVAHELLAVDGPDAVLLRARPRVGEQVVDQALHAVHAVDRELDELVRIRVQLAAVTARQQLHVAGHHAQRLGEVVRGDVGELLQVGVRALQLGRAPLQLGGDAREPVLAVLAPRDVLHLRDAVEQAAGGIVHRRGVVHHPDGGAVPAQEALLQLVVGDLAAQQLLQQRPLLLEVVGVGDLLEVIACSSRVA